MKYKRTKKLGVFGGEKIQLDISGKKLYSVIKSWTLFSK